MNTTARMTAYTPSSIQPRLLCCFFTASVCSFYSLMKANHLVFLNLEIHKERCCDICIYRYFLIVFMPFYLPAKVIRYRFPEDVIAKLEELKWWDMPEEKLKKHIALFQKENVTVEELERMMSVVAALGLIQF